MTPLESVISNILDRHISEPNAISWEDIFTVASIALRGERFTMAQVRDCIHDMRQRGELIASSSKGYFRPATLQEALAYVEKQYRGPARDELHTARIQRRAAQEYFGGQLRLM